MFSISVDMDMDGKFHIHGEPGTGISVMLSVTMDDLELKGS